jgi:type I restriction enzyme S subunit
MLTAMKWQLDPMSTGSTYEAVSADDIGDFICVLPSLKEQRGVAFFLDRETAKINALVAKKERLIELLHEKRKALITRAVTKGLDPNMPMKDSGVEWLGEIPAHWGVKRLKRIVEFRGGGTPSKNNLDYWRGDIPWVSPKDMKISVIVDTEDKITAQALRESATQLVPAGSVLLVVRSGILVHSIPVAITGREVTLNQDMKALISRAGLVPEYLMCLFSGLQKELLVEWKKEGATVESLEFELLASTPTPLPSECEQRAIAAFLDREMAKIDALISKIHEAIDKLKEYRIALISAAVTGKIDVREEGP